MYCCLSLKHICVTYKVSRSHVSFFFLNRPLPQTCSIVIHKTIITTPQQKHASENLKQNDNCLKIAHGKDLGGSHQLKGHKLHVSGNQDDLNTWKALGNRVLQLEFSLKSFKITFQLKGFKVLFNNYYVHIKFKQQLKKKPISTTLHTHFIF